MSPHPNLPSPLPPLQGDACESCPTLQGHFSDVMGIPGKPGAKGDQGAPGIGQPGRAAPARPLGGVKGMLGGLSITSHAPEPGRGRGSCPKSYYAFQE